MTGTDTRLATVAMLVLVVLAGCSGAGNGGAPVAGGGDSAESTSADFQAEPEAADAASDGGGGGEAAIDGAFSARSTSRAIVRTGEVRIEVGSYENATARLETITERHGGYVAATERRVEGSGNRSWTRGRLVLRVPSENFSAVYRGTQGVGVVESATTDTEDVTEQLVDLNARIENLRAQRDRLRTLYERANETEDVLEVGRELSEVQGEIERLEAQRRTLRDRVSMSTLTVELHEPRPDRVTRASVPFHETALVTAFLDSVDGVVVVVRTVVVGLVYATPYLLVFGLPVVGVAALLHRRR